MKIAVIGTAGRKEDGQKLTKALYSRMFHRAASEVAQLRHDLGGPVDLVSGGAAWADHLAVSLYLDDKASSLHLYLPGQFSLSPARFTERPGRRDPGRIANYYHGLFSEVMGGSTLQGIARAQQKGAKLEVIPGGFLARNKYVGQVDALVAFTFSNDGKPKDGGTSHTWKHSLAERKIHIDVGSL